MEMRFNMRDTNQQTQQRRRRAILEPVIDQNKGTIERDSINIQKNCGPDNVCIPDLRLSIHTIDTYLLGSKDLLVFSVAISNYGEDAFEAGFFMTVPSGLNFRKIERIGDARDTPITCTAPSASTNHTLKCDIGNPLSSDKDVKFKVILLPAHKQGIAPKYDFYMEANSTNAEADGTDFDNVVKKTVSISVETNLSVKGVSIDEEILYNTTDYAVLENATRENEIGPQVVHIYEIRNGGPSTIESAEVFFLWPYKTISGDDLLYLLNQPETTRNIKCEPTSFANERNLQLDKSLVSKSYLVSQGAIEKSSLHSAGGRYASTSSSDSTGHAAGGGKINFSDEEKRRIDQEENVESSGDASYVHRQRAHQAAQEQTGSGTSIGSGKGYEQSSSSSWSSSSQNGGPTITYSASRNRSAVRGEDGRLHVSEYSTEHYGGLGTQQSRGGSASGSNFHASQQSQSSDSNANIHRAGAFGAASGSGGVRRLEDFHAEGSVNQDISGLQSRTQASSASGAGGRRRMMSQQDGEPARPDLITGVSQLDKIGQGGHGFQAGMLELDTLGRDNVDQEIRRHGNTAHLAGSAGKQQDGGSSYQQSSGSQSGGQSSQHYSGSSYQGSSSGGKHGSSSSSYSQNDGAAGNVNYDNDQEFEDDYEHEEDYPDVNDNQPHESHQHQQHQYHRGQSTDGVADGVDKRIKFYGRIRRDTPNFSDLELQDRLSCNRSKCALIRCTTGPLDTDSSAWIAFRMRLVTHTMKLVSYFRFQSQS